MIKPINKDKPMTQAQSWGKSKQIINQNDSITPT